MGFGSNPQCLAPFSKLSKKTLNRVSGPPLGALECMCRSKDLVQFVKAMLYMLGQFYQCFHTKRTRFFDRHFYTVSVVQILVC